jgi:hypothetical protein
MGHPAHDLTRDYDTDVQQTPDDRGFTDRRREMIAEKVQTIPGRYRGNYEAGISGESRKAAVRSFCLECMGWSSPDVRACTALACPLFPYRIKG